MLYNRLSCDFGALWQLAAERDPLEKWLLNPACHFWDEVPEQEYNLQHTERPMRGDFVGWV